ncbi:pyruvate/2-oxoglutarate dehydrogenase complex, dihydrolipoamide dehydrogenase (E3) component, and related enzymes [Candidatus Scalindua japonica]|uniref:Dihydrolipoyl dehydrogenase n=1 Tax=Candidatus Scalindua japonica TaxID=1284222 RepID=A0A286U1V0_9BACT|nr:dihydrolipoyl dehydrogenase [Candidatus Scalindua japonica]GAX62118.1 pyruvate/2-oxoglutarate dehydrogenase complex, dihydrolipoamide dehydrogenase (E3) component, and related enzymes [Candidatus Scalindua japonica]
MKNYDLLIIGGGPGGYVAAIKGAQLGLSVGLIEMDKVGGACLHKGCIPTKALIQSTHLYELFKRSKEFGIATEGVRVDFRAFHKRKRTVVTKLFGGIKHLLKKNNVDLFDGTGQISSPGKVLLKVNDIVIEEILAKNIVVSTGSSPMVFKNLPHDKKSVLTSDDILEMEEIPSSLLIIGGGSVGIEFAYVFNVLGSEVTVVEVMDEILPTNDKDIGNALRKSLSKRGIRFLTHTELNQIEKIEDAVETTVMKNDGNAEVLQSEKVLLAMGRKPETEDLGLETLNLEYSGRFIDVDENMQTNQQGIYAIGDVTGPPMLAHLASAQGLLVSHNIAGVDYPPINSNTIPKVTYTNPQVASVGMTQEEAELKGHDVKIGSFPFMANAKTRITGEGEEGFIKIITDASSSEILGVHLIGHEVGELIGGMSLAMNIEATTLEVSANIFPHPTLSEVFSEAFYMIEGKAIHI